MVLNIVGAGLTGSTTAKRLAEKGHEVHLFEQWSHVGGNCYDETTVDGITIYKYGPPLLPYK